ncbi:MAG TPA: protoporphyrinogen oxidase [Acidimicrobiales bacterium]|nr:protoporphyrinogen oxidase [Acidimicrobiales bacterium]
MSDRVDVAVVGAGISGLAAAWEARRRGARVVVLEAAPSPGGKLRTSPFAGVALDEAADAVLAREPDAVDLLAELGMAGDLVSPATGAAHVYLDGALRKVPPQQLLGVPTDLDAVAAAGLLSPEGLARARADLTAADDRPSPGSDEAVGALVRRRLGGEVLERLVGPLVGSIYAGDCDALSLQVSAAQLAAARDLDPADPSLVRAAAALRARATGTGRPTFVAPAGGMAALVGALADALGDDLRPGSPVRALTTDGGRWRLDPAGVVADAVVVATPAFVTGPLLAPHAPAVADAIGDVEHASVALVALAVPSAGVGHPLDGSGFLVPQGAGLLLTACSWVDSKWPHLAVDRDVTLLRASVGRAGDDRPAALDDTELVAAVLADLATTMGLRASPLEVRVSRWPCSFPQPRPGHRDRVAGIEAALADVAPRVRLAGAWMQGVGVPACVRSGRRAAARASEAVAG